MARRSATLSRCAILLSSALLGALSLAPLANPAAGDSPASGDSFWVVELDQPPLTRYSGATEGLSATWAEATGEGRLDIDSAASLAYLDHLAADQNRVLDRIAATLARAPEVVFRYRVAANGVALRLEPEEISAVAGVEGVGRVWPSTDLALTTDAGPSFLGAPGVWDGSATGGLPGTRGEGILIAIIDTGINMDHPSFSDAPPDGHVYVNPFGNGVFIGWCDPDHPDWDPAWTCNDKLVGAWDYADAISTEDDGPEDAHSHGSHVAGIAVGNVLDMPPISGVAPHANLIAYDVCYRDPVVGELCPEAAVLAAVDQALLDGVDVINLSMGGGTSPWQDMDSFLLNAVTAGVFVAASADNQGPAAGTVAHRGPWLATVGASTHDRVANENILVDLAGGSSPPADIIGASLTAGWGPAPVVWAGSFDNGTATPELCLQPFPVGTWTGGEVVVCDYASGFPVAACENAADGGAGACVMANLGGVSYVEAAAHVIPGIHLDTTGGDTIRAWLFSGSGHTATLTPSQLITSPAAGDLMAGFSSRGPAGALEVLKPDLVAPGIRILAPLASGLIPDFSGAEFLQITGTSMATAFATGSAALLLALDPQLTPMELKSALSMTAATSLDDGGSPATPFARGSGRIALDAAARVGLVLDESAAAMAAADPAAGGDPRHLNLPSLIAGSCFGVCRWQRSLTVIEPGSVTWTITVTAPAGLEVEVGPDSFPSGPAGSTHNLHVVARIGDGLPLDEWAFAELKLIPDNPDLSDLHLPLAVIPTAPASLIFADGFESGDTTAW